MREEIEMPNGSTFECSKCKWRTDAKQTNTVQLNMNEIFYEGEYFICPKCGKMLLNLNQIGLK